MSDTLTMSDTEILDQIKQETRATNRCIPLDQPGTSGKCIATGAETAQQVIIARSY